MATTTIVDNLISLRGHYVSLLDDASNSTFAREQLAHVNALLVDQLQSGGGRSSAKAIAAAAPAPAATPAAASPVRGPAKTPGRRGAKAGRAAAPKAPKTRGTVGSRIKLTMADEFQGLSKIDAVGKIMEEKRNQIVHMNDIINIMFGELDDKEMKAEQMRMKDTLIRGVRRGLWQKAKGVPLSYFLGSMPTGVAKATATKTAKAPRAAKKAAPTRRKAAAPIAKKTRVTTPKTKAKTTASKVKTLSASARKKAVPARKGGRTAKK